LRRENEPAELKTSRGRCFPPENNNPEPVGIPRSTKLIMDLATNSDCEKMNKSSVPTAPAHAEGHVAKPRRRPPRPYFARLDPGKDLKKQMASRMVQFLCAESDEDGCVIYMRMYHSLHGNRDRDRNGEDLWAEALKYLGRAIRRKHGLMWIDGKRMVPDLPSPYKPMPKFSSRKRRPKTPWYKAFTLTTPVNESHDPFSPDSTAD